MSPVEQSLGNLLAAPLEDSSFLNVGFINYDTVCFAQPPGLLLITPSEPWGQDGQEADENIKLILSAVS